MVGVGAMIGAGIFVLTGLAAETAGPAAVLVFGLNGGVTAFTALSYAELASAIPKNGGGYAYVRETFSDPVAFVMGWTRWFTYMSAGALYALGFASNFVEFVHLYWAGLPAGPLVSVPLAGTVGWELVYALVAVLSFVGLNARSTEAASGAETAVTLVKIAILAVFVVFGITAVDGGQFRPFFPPGGPTTVLPAMGLTFIAFQGYDLIATVTEEVEDPRRTIPRAIVLSLVLTVAIYLLVVGISVGVLGAERLGMAGETAVAEAAVEFMPDVGVFGASLGAALIAFGAVFSTISALNAVVIGSSRVAFAMGREGQLPSRLGQVHHDYGTPYVAVLASAVVMLVATALAPVTVVGNLASLFSLLGFVVVNLAVIRLRRDRPDLSRPFEVPLYPATPVLGIVLNVVLSLYIAPRTWAIAVGWLAFGLVVYGLLNRATVAEALPVGGSDDASAADSGADDAIAPSDPTAGAVGTDESSVDASVDDRSGSDGAGETAARSDVDRAVEPDVEPTVDSEVETGGEAGGRPGSDGSDGSEDADGADDADDPVEPPDSEDADD